MKAFELLLKLEKIVEEKGDNLIVELRIGDTFVELEKVAIAHFNGGEMLILSGGEA